MHRIFLLCIVLAITAPLLAGEDAVFLHHTVNGINIVEEEGLPNTGSYQFFTDDPSVMWSRSISQPIYTTTRNCGEGYVFTGTYLNDPREVELFAPTGGGVPEWTYQGTEFYVGASDNNFILGAGDENSGGVTIYKWTGPGAGVPDWSANFPGVNISSYGPYIAVSRDGSTLAAALTDAGTARLLMFENNSATPVVNHLAAGLSFPRNMAVSSDGHFGGVRTNTHIIIFDRIQNSVREELHIGFGATPFDISGDGNTIAYGWSSLEVRGWGGSSYTPLWTHSEPGYYLASVSLSADGSTIAAGWYTSSFNSARVTVHNTASATPLWRYTFAASSGVYQETIKSIELSADGRYIITGSWGDNANVNPEVHIFDRDLGSNPYYTVDMPGSVFSVDISADGRFATACGKHVHANVSGRGGDIVAVDLDLASTALELVLTPLNPPLIIPGGGGGFAFDALIVNHSTDPVFFEAWTEVVLPNGNIYGPLIERFGLMATPEDSITRRITQNVPPGAPSGNYTYVGNVRTFPDSTVVSDSFPFVKLAGLDGVLGSQSWEVFGWLDEGAFTTVSSGIPENYALSTASPNPFNPTTTIRYTLPEAGDVSLVVYDVQGRVSGFLVNGWMPAGNHSVVFDGSGLASGVYFYQLNAEDFSDIGKMTLIK